MDIKDRKLSLLSRIFGPEEVKYYFKDCLSLNLLQDIEIALREIIDPRHIEKMVALGLQKYDRSQIFYGEKEKRLTDYGFDPMFTIQEDKFSLNTSAPGRVILPNPRIDSKSFKEILLIGFKVPTYLTDEGDIFRAIFLEKETDPTRYLLAEFFRKDNEKMNVKFETNDRDYALNHNLKPKK